MRPATALGMMIAEPAHFKQLLFTEQAIELQSAAASPSPDDTAEELLPFAGKKSAITDLDGLFDRDARAAARDVLEPAPARSINQEQGRGEIQAQPRIAAPTDPVGGKYWRRGRHTRKTTRPTQSF